MANSHIIGDITGKGVKKTDKCEKEKENDKDTFAAYFQLILI